MKLVYQYVVFFFNFQVRLNHLHPVQVENCDSNSRLVLDEDDNSKFGLERVKKRIKRAANRLFLGPKHRGFQLINSVKIELKKMYLHLYHFSLIKSE